MKAATGELNLTVITIVAIALVIGFFTAILWPNIKESINTQWSSVSGTGTNGQGDVTGGHFGEGGGGSGIGQ